jgi:hypothetical protein
MLGMRPKLISLVGCFALCILVSGAFILYLSHMRLEWHSKDIQVDVNSGRMRKTWYFLGINVREVVLEDDFSRTWTRLFGPYKEPKWARTARLPLLGRQISPAYGYDATFYAELTVANAFDLARFDDDAQRQVMRTFIALLREGAPYSAREYAIQVANLSAELYGKRISTNELNKMVFQFPRGVQLDQ